MTAKKRVLIIAGELSGDILGGAIIQALRQLRPDLEFEGVAGPRMRAQGCVALDSIESLSVMGFIEVLPAIPRILKLRRRLKRHALATRPDLVIGIDAPDFNLPLERQLKSAGIATLHIVSPTIWAWREGRVYKIAKSVDRILCLLPFEPHYYEKVGLAADFIGHPLADELSGNTTAEAARQALQLRADRPCVAVLPGSRKSEINYLMPVFTGVIQQLAAKYPQIQWVTPIAKPSMRPLIQAYLQDMPATLSWTLLDGQSREAMQAAEVVLLASGTATLECMLVERPMVVAYRGSAFSAFLLLTLGMLKTKFVSLPNLLADQPVVPELLHKDATIEQIAHQIEQLLMDPVAAQRQRDVFASTASQIRCNAANRAAKIISQILSAEANS